MEIKRISSQVLSIYLDEDDMNELNVTYGTFDIFSPHTCRVIQQLLECALAQTGFDTETAERLAIEIYPIEDNSCLLLFTIINSKEHPYNTSRKEKVEASAPTLLCFSDFREVVDFCCKLNKTLPETDSALYWKQGQYILVFTEEVKPLPSGAVFCDPEDRELLLAELQENKLILIPEKAVQKLLKYFN